MKKGFTLIELLGVIVIIALLMAIAFPSILNTIKNSSEETDNLTEKLIYNAADLYISNHSDEFAKSGGTRYKIELKDLVDEGLLISPIRLSDNKDITNNKCIKVTYVDEYKYELKEKGECERLPSEYQEVEYIESTGTQYIDTAILTQQSLKIECEFSTTADSKCLFGGRAISTSNGLVFGHFTTNSSYVAFGGTSTTYPTTISLIDGIKHKVVLSQDEYLLDDEPQTRNNVNLFTDYINIFLFTWNTNGVADSRIFRGKVYSYKVFDDDVLIQNFIPCYRKSDNEIGMYDTVNNIFYTNQGTGKFIKGPNT